MKDQTILSPIKTHTFQQHNKRKRKIQESTPESPRKEDRAREVDGKFDVVCCRKFLILMVNAKFPAAFAFLMMFFLFFHQFFAFYVVYEFSSFPQNMLLE
jgi:hypothetical protein